MNNGPECPQKRSDVSEIASQSHDELVSWRCLWRRLGSKIREPLWLLLVFSILFYVAIKYRAESNLLTVFLSYLPAWTLASLPVLCLLTSVIFANWHLSFASAVVAVTGTLWLGGFHLRVPWRERQGVKELQTLKVMTYNRGQGASRVLGDFQRQIDADIAVFQDAGRRLSQISEMPEFSGFRHGQQVGEFVLISRWPIVESAALDLDWTETPGRRYRAGCRTIVDWDGTLVAVYNLHLPTPRDLLYWYASRGTFLYGLLGLVPGTPLAERHLLYLRPWRARIEMISRISALVRDEVVPVVLMGDLNMPPAGESYQILCDLMQDAHMAAGSGFGSTFPANLRSIARVGSPWLRIDHIFLSGHWKVILCESGLNYSSQHLPVGAILRLR